MPNVIDVNKLCMSCMSVLEDTAGVCPVCGYDGRAPLSDMNQLRPKSILNGKYLVGRVLGEGGFGITYLGWDLNLNVRVAIKEYFPSGLVTRRDPSAPSAAQPFSGPQREVFVKGLDRFLEEARSLAKFRSLPGIVSVKDYFSENGTAYIVMEYIEGQTLKEYMARYGGVLPYYQVLSLMRPILSSLEKIHAEGMIHRDISPDNIMLDREGKAVLVDFGAAHDFSDGERSVSVLLKPGYTPVEQYQSRGIQKPYTDIYALCATMYKMITGQTPPDSLDRLESDTLEAPSRLGVTINENLERVLMKGLRVNRLERYQSVGELSAALYGWDNPVPPPPEPKPEPPAPQPPVVSQGVKVQSMIITAFNLALIIAGVYLLSIFDELWVVPLFFVCNLIYRVYTIIKKKNPSATERRIHAAVLAGAQLLFLFWALPLVLSSLNIGYLSHEAYKVIFIVLVIALLALFAEALYEALAAVREAKGQGRKRVPDILLICALAVVPVVFIITIVMPGRILAPLARMSPSSYKQIPDMTSASPTDIPAESTINFNINPTPTNSALEVEDQMHTLFTSEHVITILCVKGSILGYAMRDLLEIYDLNLEITEYDSWELLHKLNLNYATGEMLDIFVWDNPDITNNAPEVNGIINNTELIDNGIYISNTGFTGDEKSLVLFDIYSDVFTELSAVIKEMSKEGTDLNTELISSMDDVRNAAG